MGEARLAVRFCGPLVTLQDGGRVGHLRYGVPGSGPMDRVAFATAHAALGNAPGLTALEISIGGIILECKEGTVTVAIAGGDFAVEHDGNQKPGWGVLTLGPGEKLSIKGGKSGSWAYLAFAGEVNAQQWLGSTSTLSTSQYGGGIIRSDQELVISNAAVREEREGNIERPGFLKLRDRMRVVMGPQDRWFKASTIDSFLNEEFQLTTSFDRMGVRLDGPFLLPDGALSIPSEPIVRGSVQVSGEGVPTVLFADHQTTGGYPKIATLISMDCDLLSQRRSGDSTAFEAVSPEKAVAIIREFGSDLHSYLERVGIPRGSLAQRLMRENLISGAW